MKMVVFGLTISSSWGNGHATILRGLFRALHGRGHSIVFFERDVPYYAAHRDCTAPDYADLRLYTDWDAAAPLALRELAYADVGMVTSYCPDGTAATESVLSSPATLKVFYDLDTPVTLQTLKRGQRVPYIGPRGLRDFDLVLSFTGGAALEALRRDMGAKRVAPLYGCVDPAAHYPVPPVEDYRADLSYLGTYAQDRQEALEALFIAAARQHPERRFLIGGSLYPPAFPWAANIYYIDHIPPVNHPAFYCSSPFTLNVTRQAMAAMGYCPSGRLFEAAACATPVISDSWEGLDHFYRDGSEIVVARDAEAVMDALSMPAGERKAMAERAQERTFDEHTAWHRARELERHLCNAYSRNER